MIITILFSLLFAGNESYTTYADLTVFVEREGELGAIDVVEYNHVISKTVHGNITTLRIYQCPKCDKLIITIQEPKERIVKEIE